MKSKSFVYISVGLYLLSCAVPIFNGSDYTGIAALFLGWMGVFSLSLNIGLPWIANILYFINLFAFKKKPITRLILAVFTVLFGLLAVGISEVLIDEGGQMADVSVGLGFYFWISSFAVLLAVRLARIRDI